MSTPSGPTPARRSDDTVRQSRPPPRLGGGAARSGREGRGGGVGGGGACGSLAGTGGGSGGSGPTGVSANGHVGLAAVGSPDSQMSLNGGLRGGCTHAPAACVNWSCAAHALNDGGCSGAAAPASPSCAPVCFARARAGVGEVTSSGNALAGGGGEHARSPARRGQTRAARAAARYSRAPPRSAPSCTGRRSSSRSRPARPPARRAASTGCRSARRAPPPPSTPPQAADKMPRGGAGGAGSGARRRRRRTR